MKIFRVAASALALLTALVISNSLWADEAAPAPKQGSAVWEWDKLVAKKTGVGERRDVTDLATPTIQRFECHISTLNPGEISHPPHHHAQEEFIIIKEGTLDVSINGRTTRVGPGSLFFFASNDVHNVKNVGDVPSTYFVFNLATAATKTVPSAPAAESAAADKLKSSVFDWTKLEAKPTKVGERRDIVDSPTVTCARLEAHVTTLRAGEIPHPGHRHPSEELVIVREGTMEATINGVAHRAGPGSIFFFASNDEHALKNVGSTTATYHVIRITTEATPLEKKS